ncbi:MAG: VWA domain-containing protein [Muribaculaceae bacterium]|nr:VWA domain-containing protein [Muribaculaceae bacterium]
MMLHNPRMLWLLLVLVPLTAWYVWKQRNSRPWLGISSAKAFVKLPLPRKIWVMHFCFLLQLLAVAALIVALARPQTTDSERTSRIVGTDIVLAIDISGSMSATDFAPNRFEAAKQTATQFVNNRPNDNMGLVVFAGESLSLMPLTTDRAALVNAVQGISMGALDDGTAIGDGLSSAINRIASGKAKSKSIIMLTDGTNNAGNVPPLTAAAIAKQKGIKVYTIGVGTNGTVQITDPYGFSSTTLETKIDEESLKSIAATTGGKYFRAKDEKMLRKVFDEIDSLEKTELDVDQYTQTDENYMPWVWIAMGAWSLFLLLRYTLLRRIP